MNKNEKSENSWAVKGRSLCDSLPVGHRMAKNVAKRFQIFKVYEVIYNDLVTGKSYSILVKAQTTEEAGREADAQAKRVYSWYQNLKLAKIILHPRPLKFVIETMLDGWWLADPNSYLDHWEAGITGTEMLKRLKKSDPELYKALLVGGIPDERLVGKLSPNNEAKYRQYYNWS